MPDSFSELRSAGGPNKPWVAGGIVVLLIAVTAAVISAIFSLTRSDPEAHLSTAVVTVTAEAAPSHDDESENLTRGTYTGTLSSDSRSWVATITLAGDTAMITYPHSSCTALLTRSGEDDFDSEAMSKQCRGTGGTWNITEPERGILQLVYATEGRTRAQGVLSLISP